MSTSTIKSNLVGKNGTETVTNFATIGDSSTALVGASLTSSGAISGTTITGTGAVTGASLSGGSGAVTGGSATMTGKVKAGTYFQIGAHQYIFVDTSATAAVVLANATAIDASVKNSFVLGNKQMHFIVSNATINTITATALKS